MRKSFSGFTIDRERAVKLAALIGLLVLGASTLPGLLRTPEPPPVPAGVGFDPAELTGFSDRQLADSRVIPATGKERPEKRAKGAGDARPVRKRKPAERPEPRESSGRTPAATSPPETTTTSQGPAPASSGATSPAPASSPAPVPAAPPPAPLPPQTKPPAPSDGSQEFAPR